MTLMINIYVVFTMMAIRMLSMRMDTRIWYTEWIETGFNQVASKKVTCPHCHADKVEELKGELLIFMDPLLDVGTVPIVREDYPPPH